MADLIRRKDWSQTPLGPIESWPQSLRTVVNLCVESNFPINIVWGPEHIQIYNDGYRVVCGDVHPRSLGENYRVTWATAWPVIGDSFERALGGETMFLENQRMFLKRLNNALEETFFTFSHSPIRDERGEVGGLFHPVTETTATMVAERRTRALRDLSASLGVANDEAEVASRTVEVLSQYNFDLPFVLYYAFDPQAGLYRLAANCGIEAGLSATPLTIGITDASPWPVAEALSKSQIVEIQGISATLQGVPAGPYEEAPDRGLVLPIIIPAAERPPAIVVTAASSRLAFTDDYRSFYGLLSVTAAGALATVRAREDERRRAEALAEIDRAKTLFFSNVSHEFRTPLTLMLGPLEEALAGTGLPKPERERLDMAHRNSLRLLKLVNSLLDFSRIEAGRTQAIYEPVDLAEVTADLASNFRSACERAGLALVVDCPPVPEPVYVDRDMWEKIVLNLLSNAFKFTFEGEIAVRLQTLDRQVALTVSDTGVGVPEHELPRLFERFHRIEGQKSRTFEGSGIGLALVHELAKLHGGTITADSKAGEGTTFTVVLPLGTSHLPHDRLGAERNLASTSVRADAYVQEALRWLPDEASVAGGSRESEAQNDAPAELAGARILLADDNADMRAYVRRMLGPYCEVETAPDGLEALEAIRRRRPDLVLADVMMPRMDGFELLRAIRADAELRSMPVIMLSARAGEESRVEGLEAGADDYLVKPFSSRELNARVLANLKLDRVRRESTAALRESEARVRAYLHASFNVVYRMSADWSELLFADGKEFVESTSKPDSDWLSRYVHPDDQLHVKAAVHEAIRTKSTFELEYRVRRLDGTFGWTSSRAVPMFDQNGRILEWFGTATDITDRKKHEEHLKLLLNELNHRVKNTLAMVQSIAVQTLRNSSDTAEARSLLESRLIALSRAHDILTRENWEGAALRGIVEEVTAPYAGRKRNRIAIDGPDVRIPPRFALAIAMALHELSTNAVKYGALSTDAGKVVVNWTVEGANGARALAMRWTERGGPTVLPPAQRGFGSRLIERGLKQDLGGHINLLFQPAGVVCTIEAPLT